MKDDNEFNAPPSYYDKSGYFNIRTPDDTTHLTDAEYQALGSLGGALRETWRATVVRIVRSAARRALMGWHNLVLGAVAASVAQYAPEFWRDCLYLYALMCLIDYRLARQEEK